MSRVSKRTRSFLKSFGNACPGCHPPCSPPLRGGGRDEPLVSAADVAAGPVETRPWWHTWQFWLVFVAVAWLFTLYVG